MKTEIKTIREQIRIFWNPKNDREYMTSIKYLKNIKETYGTTNPDEIWEIIR